MESGLDGGAFGQDVVFDPVPEGDQEFSGEGDDADFSQAFRAGAEASLIPKAEGRSRLKPEPGPCDFNGHAASPFVAGLVDALFSIGSAAVERCWGESDEGSDLFAVFELSRGKEFCGEDPGTVVADGAETLELVSDLGVFGLALDEQAPTFFFDGEDLRTDEAEPVMLEEDSDSHAPGERGSIPKPLFFEPRFKVLGNRVDSNAVIGEEALDPIDVAGRVLFQRFEFAVELTRVFPFHRGNLDNAPCLFTEVPTDEHGDQLDGVEAIGLAATRSARYLDGGGVDDDVLNTDMSQKTVQPESVATGLVAADNPGVWRKAEAFDGFGNLLDHGFQVTGRDGWRDPRFLAEAHGGCELPGLPAKLKCHKESWVDSIVSGCWCSRHC